MLGCRWSEVTLNSGNPMGIMACLQTSRSGRPIPHPSRKNAPSTARSSSSPMHRYSCPPDDIMTGFCGPFFLGRVPFVRELVGWQQRDSDGVFGVRIESEAEFRGRKYRALTNGLLGCLKWAKKSETYRPGRETTISFPASQNIFQSSESASVQIPRLGPGPEFTVATICSVFSG